MRMTVGSLQRKGEWWYLKRGNRWNALHTTDQREAEKRAAERFGAWQIQDDEAAYLQKLIDAGEIARAKVVDNKFGKASFHSLRSTFITAMDEAGVSRHVTDAITGHAPTDVHGMYSQPGREVLMRSVVGAVRALGV